MKFEIVKTDIGLFIAVHILNLRHLYHCVARESPGRRAAVLDFRNIFCFKMREEDVETAIKVVVVGNGAVGKSSMIQRYCKGIFTKDYKKTIGVDFLERQVR
jgi:hypothetical protein